MNTPTIENDEIDRECASLRKFAHELLDIVNRQDRSGDISANKVKHIVDKMLQRANQIGPLSQAKEDKLKYDK